MARGGGGVTSWREEGVGARVPLALIAPAALIAFIAPIAPRQARGSLRVPTNRAVAIKNLSANPARTAFCSALFPIQCIPAGCECFLQPGLSRLCCWESRSLSLRAANSPLGARLQSCSSCAAPLAGISATAPKTPYETPGEP